jgi:hypothetical protein
VETILVDQSERREKSQNFNLGLNQRQNFNPNVNINAALLKQTKTIPDERFSGIKRKGFLPNE